MATNRLIRLARRWQPDPTDQNGEDQKRLIEFLLARNAGWQNPVAIDAARRDVGFQRRYTRSAFQHKLLGPLRRRRDVFVGTGSRGIFLVTSPLDADQTLAFYTGRVRSELRHARNLRNLARRTNLFQGRAVHRNPRHGHAVIYIDESGTPSINDLTPPVFIVSAVVIESRAELSALEQRFVNACAIIRHPIDREVRSDSLSASRHRQVLRELSLVEYQWASACFVKPQLTSAGFSDPLTLYKYAMQFLIGELLTIAWQAELVLDEYSTASFQAELETYLRQQNSGLPVQRLNTVAFAQSSKSRLIQLADLVAGAVRRHVAGEPSPLREIGDKMINLQLWPPLD